MLMGDENYENLSILMSSVDIYPVLPIQNEYICVYCQRLLINARQAPCGCRFCKLCISKFLEANTKWCPGNEEECKSFEITNSTVFRTDVYVNRNILKLRVLCPTQDCNFECELKNLDDHARICRKQKIKCPYSLMGCTTADLKKDNIGDHLNKANVEHVELITSSTLNIINDVTFLKKQLLTCAAEIKICRENSNNEMKEIEMQKQELENSQKMIKWLVEENNQLKIAFNNILEKCESTSLNVSSLKEFIWRIDDVRSKHNMAKAFLGEVSSSDPFYSHENGYKLRLQAFLNGVDPFKGQFLFVGFQILKGPYDELLDWPFNYKVGLSLLNPDTKTEHVTFKYDVVSYPDYKYIFEQPLTPENDFLGDNEFISFKELFSSSCLVKNGAIFIKCSINHL